MMRFDPCLEFQMDRAQVRDVGLLNIKQELNGTSFKIMDVHLFGILNYDDDDFNTCISSMFEQDHLVYPILQFAYNYIRQKRGYIEYPDGTTLTRFMSNLRRHYNHTHGS